MINLPASQVDPGPILLKGRLARKGNEVGFGVTMSLWPGSLPDPHHSSFGEHADKTQPPATVTEQGQQHSRKLFPKHPHWNIIRRMKHSVHLSRAGHHTGSFPMISSIPRNTHLRQVSLFPFYKWENWGKSVQGHTAGKHMKWSSESLSKS